MRGRPRAVDAIIRLDQATKDYGRDRGVFGLSFAVERGEVVGFLGANGAGKSVTMRMLMGFVRPTSGRVLIGGRDCFAERARIQRSVGYLPGELACPADLTGTVFLDFVAAMRGARDRRRRNELVEFFELDPSARIRSMSKGTKQKLGIVAAFMGAPEVLLLDEPTSGLDLLMQRRFVELVRAERERGATVLLSSHVLGEVEGTCDRAVFIRHGRLSSEAPAGDLTLDSTLERLYGAEALSRHWGATAGAGAVVANAAANAARCAAESAAEPAEAELATVDLVSSSPSSTPSKGGRS